MRPYTKDENGWIHIEDGDGGLPPAPHARIPVGADQADLELWLDNNCRSYLVHIVGAKVATLLYYTGDGLFMDFRGTGYKVDKWQELPDV